MARVTLKLNDLDDQLIPTTIGAITHDPTGFDDPGAVTVSYNSTTRKITLTGTFTAYWEGRIITELVDGWVSPAHDDVAGSYWLYYNGSTFTWYTSAWTFNEMQIAYVYYPATNRFGVREPHGLMDWRAHEEFHRVVGTYRQSGGDLSGYTAGSTTAANRRPDVSETVIYDEDNPATLPALTTELYTQVYLSSTSTVNFVVDAADIVPLSTNNPYYNQFTGGAWQQTLVPNNQYMSVWLMAVPVTSDAASQKYRYIWVQGQSAGTLVQQQALTPNDVSLGGFTSVSAEFVFLAKVIIQYTAANWTITSVTSLTGSRFSQSGSAAGYLSTVAVDGTTITGDGTTGNPLIAVYPSRREILSAARTYYVSTTGNDSNNGLTSGAPFLTIQKAIDTVATIDSRGYAVTISLADGTYTTGATMSVPLFGAGTLTIRGNTTTPANVLLSTTSANGLQFTNRAIATVNGMEMRTTTSGSCIYAQGGSLVNIGANMIFGACATYHIRVTEQSAVYGNNYSITGGATEHLHAEVLSLISFTSRTVTLTGTFAFNIFCNILGAQYTGFNTTYNVTAATITGTRFSVSLNGVINTYGGGANVFPGSIAGTTPPPTGGQYA